MSSRSQVEPAKVAFVRPPLPQNDRRVTTMFPATNASTVSKCSKNPFRRAARAETPSPLSSLSTQSAARRLASMHVDFINVYFCKL